MMSAFVSEPAGVAVLSIATTLRSAFVPAAAEALTLPLSVTNVPLPVTVVPDTPYTILTKPFSTFVSSDFTPSSASVSSLARAPFSTPVIEITDESNLIPKSHPLIPAAGISAKSTCFHLCFPPFLIEQ